MQRFIKQNPMNDQHLPKIYAKCLVDVCFGFEVFAPTTVVVTNEETRVVCVGLCGGLQSDSLPRPTQQSKICHFLY